MCSLSDNNASNKDNSNSTRCFSYSFSSRSVG